jgi:leucyl aminopeptidase
MEQFMEFKAETRSLSRISADKVVLGIFQDENVEKQILKLDKTFPTDFLKYITQLCNDEGFKGKSGQTVLLPTYGQIDCKTLILWGLGKVTDYKTSSTRKFAANVARKSATTNGSRPVVSLFLRIKDDAKPHVQAAVEGTILGGYTFIKYKSVNENNPAKSKPSGITLAGAGLTGKEFNDAVERGSAIAEATCMARDLIAEPAAYMTPSRLAQEAKRICKAADISCTIMDVAQVEKLGMGAFMGVARGAKELPKFIVMHYAPAKAKKTICIVGKGITFDSGGLSLKPANSMENMKYDMSGAAAVIGTMQVVGRVRPPVGVMGIVAATENMPGGSAYHPGDVLTAMNGKTIEVNNTDAEGRLILADALSYACQQKVDEIIDLATLTGACVAALGRVAAGIMGSDQELIERLIAAADEGGEKLWQLPLYEEYKETLKSDIADLKNAGAKGEAGTSSAALFLKEFVDSKPWAHLDIAGPGWLEKEKDELNKGGTAFGVRTLCRYILSQDNVSRRAPK